MKEAFSYSVYSPQGLASEQLGYLRVFLLRPIMILVVVPLVQTRQLLWPGRNHLLQMAGASLRQLRPGRTALNQPLRHAFQHLRLLVPVMNRLPQMAEASLLLLWPDRRKATVTSNLNTSKLNDSNPRQARRYLRRSGRALGSSAVLRTTP